jgi:phosphoribosylformylglycinamidine synthase
MFEIEIFKKKGFKNSYGEHVLSDISGLGVKNITKVEYSPLYLIDGDIDSSEAKMIASELLSDKITESYTVRRYSDLSSKAVNSQMLSSVPSVSVIEVWYKKGVTDTVAESVVKAIKDLGIDKDVKVRAARKYYLYSAVSQTFLNSIATKLLANTLVQEYKIK